MKRGSKAWIMAAAVGVSTSHVAHARPGTHGLPVSTWDTRASTIAFSARPGFMDGGHFHQFGYNANFTATSGVLSSQFGLHYLNFADTPEAATAHGLSGTAIALVAKPLGDRYETGLPKGALAFYFGGAPAALVSGERSYLTIPAVVGMGATWTPALAISITPWIEAAPGINLDTVVRPVEVDPATFQIPMQPGPVRIDRGTVEQIVASGLEIEASVTFATRLGLDFTFHLGDSVDLNLGAALGSLGNTFQGKTVAFVNSGLVFQWDAVVPAVLPPEKRLARERCEDIEARWQICQAVQRSTPTAPAASPAPPVPPSAAPPQSPPAPPPRAPAPAPAPPAPPAPSPPAGPAAPPPPPPPESPRSGDAAPGSGVPTAGFPD